MRDERAARVDRRGVRARRRTASVCTGAFVLAAAGLLDGRRATTHWAAAAALARRVPGVEVDAEPIFVRDGEVWTSAGVTAGMDLALALVEEDLDREAALTIARQLVLFLRRPGNQSQFSATLAAQQPAARAAARGAAARARGHRAAINGRGDGRARAHEPAPLRARVPRRDGLTPARYVERVRLEAARRRLEDGAEPVAAIAAAAASARPRRCAACSCARSLRRSALPRRSTAGACASATAPRTSRASATRRHKRDKEMNTAILLYDGFTALDAIGPYEVLSRLPGATVTFVAAEAGPVRTDNGMLTLRRRALAGGSHRAPDIVLVPGGPGEVAARAGGAALDWLRAAHATSTWTTSVCTGSLILAAAGLLDGQARHEPLAGAGEARARWAPRRSPSASCSTARSSPGRASRRVSTWRSRWPREIAGEQVAQAIQLGIEYDPQPPFDAGSPQKAPAEIVALLRGRSRFVAGEDALGAALAARSRRVAGRQRTPRRRRPLTCDLRWPSTYTNRTRSSRAGRRCGRASARGRSATRTTPARRSSNSYVLEMLPYPSGEPHIGHLKCYSLGDAIAHFHRRLGRRVLHPMGYDAFGLPAENHAIKTGVHPRDSTAESIASFQRQFRSWGISIDWSRELATQRTELLPLDAVDLPRAVPRGPRLPQGGGGQVVPARSDGARQRAGRRRGALRALRDARRGAPAGAVVPAHHRLRRAPARRPRRDRLAGERQDDAAQLDRALGGRRGDVPLRGAGDRLSGVHDATGHAVRRDVLRDGARASRT